MSVLLALALAASASPAVYPPPRVTVAFSHARHAREALRCAHCHDDAAAKDAASERRLPGHARCRACHDVEARVSWRGLPASSCDGCHPGFDGRVRIAPDASRFPRANLSFSHRRHAPRVGPGDDGCARCHPGVAAAGLATEDHLPRMATCLSCHDGRAAPAGCALCHLAEPAAKGARLRTSFASGALKPGPGDPLGLDHGPPFPRAHAAQARARPDACAACHSDASCRQCHDGTARQAVHPAGYVKAHAVDARRDEPRCASCHRAQSFCVACHERAGIGAQADAALREPGVRVHPPGWNVPGPTHHGVEASRRIGSCAACHRESACTSCHGAGVGGVNPHPPSWRSTCGELVRRNPRACAKCHAGDVASRCR